MVLVYGFVIDVLRILFINVRNFNVFRMNLLVVRVIIGFLL